MPLFVTINFKTWKVDLFMPKLDPKIKVISGPEIMYLWGKDREIDREREREEMKKVERYRPAQKVGCYICSTGVEGASAANSYTSQSGSDPVWEGRGGAYVS
jgi:hypothetical protein